MTSSELISALREHVAGQPVPEGLSVVLNVDGGCELPPNEAQGLFRIAQEALNNIIKHANAKNAHMHFHMDAPFWVTINDDGRGFDQQQAFEGGHIGLASMHERAEEIGWDISIQSAPGEGTHIRVEKKVLLEERL
jgi:two-component system nitrate/nitrite sensor histidine kinase NarX